MNAPRERMSVFTISGDNRGGPQFLHDAVPAELASNPVMTPIRGKT